MSDIKNPFDSLQDYFDDLLPSEELSPTPKAQALESAIKPAKPPIAHRTAARKASPKVAPDFAEPDAAKKEKLQKLLSSAQPKIAVAPIVKVAPVEVVAQPKTTFVNDPNEIQEWVIETAAPIVDAQPIVETPAVVEAETTSFKIPGLEWMPNGLPQWAQSRFDVLLFKVSGLTLAVPLISLGQIQPITDELAPLFGQADWFMGFQPTPQGKIRTVNTAKFVMPERYDESFVKNAKYVVSINGVPWGLAVDSVNQPISLMPDEVKWRSDRSKRPWLAGTVKEHMCALLDIPMIGQMLMEADKNLMKSRA
ncbi:chemotaxis protein CheW [Cellvibrio sp.]|uniref:chemotaxis protein CheW n=1 Tax=Cellvibrio sp. TaxID=1965322 RepID=UPI0039648A1B